MQVTVGKTEELTFRGVLLVLLDRVFEGRVRVPGAEVRLGTLTNSLVFETCPGLRSGPEDYRGLSLLSMVILTVGGFVLVWCRARNGSLLLLIFVYSGMKEAAQLIALVKVWP